MFNRDRALEASMFNCRPLVFATLGLALGLLTLGGTILAQNAPTANGLSQVDSSKKSAVLVQITGEVPKPAAISPEEFAKLPRRSLRASAHDGVERQYDGVALVDVLAHAGVPTEKDVRGPALALFVVVEAADGYRVVYSLAELDRSFTDRVILLADRRDGQPLSARDGPLQVVVPGEKKHARWVRQVVRLKVGRG
jgi:DMSO/TMAO reductase YedYZ molybdopterin-dependent catalytic subunit